ncbi:MAG TPA: serine/threonine-protein kinase, partial [bacterium]|nr:serine/threonine-protein kinase [bacterium]
MLPAPFASHQVQTIRTLQTSEGFGATFYHHGRTKDTDMIGQTISHYKVTQKLGGGGMGIVYKAEDTHLHRPVALKFLPPELTRDEKAKQRFIQEARAASSLDHPNICTIYEINEDEAGHSFISMAYYEGLTLKQKLEDGPLPVAEAREILTNIARGLSKAHENGIIHRDIKPANIFITNDGMVKILDFGIAKLAGQSQLTRTGSTIGTMVYMSPEQIQGKPVDQRTDLWSLGVISYEMLAGWPPYQGEYEQALMYAILTESPDPIREMNTEVSPLLVDIIRKCLAKNPEERYTSVTALLKDLQREAPGTESTSTPITSQSPVRRTVRRHTRTVLLSGVLAVILVLAMLAYRQNTGSSQPPDRLAVAVTDFENTTGENELEGLSGLFITALEQSRNLSVLTRSRMFDLMKQMGGEPGDRINESVGQEIARYANIHALVTATIRKFDQVYTIELNVIDPIRDEYLFTATAKGNTKGSIPG